jgi:hypothetical protein
MTKLGFVVLFAAGAALAQGKPTLVDFPLDVKSALSEAQLGELQDDFRQMLARNNGLLVPTKTNWKLAVAAHRRQDCEVRNECLQQLAISAATLYALYCSVEKNASGEVTATGRVVNQDGVLVRPPEQVKLARGASFNDTAREALKQLLAKLALERLSPVLEKRVEETKDPVAVAGPGLQAVPPPPDATLRTVGFVTGGLAVVGAAVAVGFGVSASATRGGLPSDGRFSNEAEASAQRSVNQGATIALVAGSAAVALAATSVVMFVLSVPSTDATISVAPGPGGATMLFSGRF